MISVEECLNGWYSPEYEYVDGALIETNIGEIKGDVIAAESPRLELTRDEIFRD